MRHILSRKARVFWPVVDFIDVGFGDVRLWTFNVADAGITVGVLHLALTFGRAERQDGASPMRRQSAD